MLPNSSVSACQRVGRAAPKRWFAWQWSPSQQGVGWEATVVVHKMEHTTLHGAKGSGAQRKGADFCLPSVFSSLFSPHGVPKTAMIAYETCAGVHALSVFYVTLHAVKRHKDVSFYHLQPQRSMFCPCPLPASLCRNHGASTAHGQPFAAAHPHISTYIPCPCNTFAISAS